ncbi:hypothetical protein [Streptomyces sp. NPDC005953]|uniref:hypothetical protein n=1 Tax=Streptomyces sp. NPDC005953 TaxID=3156719 RepID=UPI00340AE212
MGRPRDTNPRTAAQLDQEQWLELRGRLLDRTHPTLAARPADAPEQHERVIAFKVFAYDGLVEHARTEITSAHQGQIPAQPSDRGVTALSGRGACARGGRLNLSPGGGWPVPTARGHDVTPVRR